MTIEKRRSWKRERERERETFNLGKFFTREGALPLGQFSISFLISCFEKPDFSFLFPAELRVD